jgi:hypothetical protein
MIQNELIQQEYKIAAEEMLLNISEQEGFFYRVFPEQVEIGSNKPKTLEWMIGRTKDGSGLAAPREMIHLLNSLRETQVRRLEIGASELGGDQLFARAAFKDALVDVSKARLEQTLYAEYPNYRDRLEELRGGRTSHTARSLSQVWNVEAGEAASTANGLSEIGFFEKRGSKDEPEYWVPFLYRDALDMIQGTAEG